MFTADATERDLSVYIYTEKVESAAAHIMTSPFNMQLQHLIAIARHQIQ